VVAEVVGIGNENFADEKLLLVYFFCQLIESRLYLP
jgi:hypothetical protein